ncbi:omptin family outer membrane protease [Myroides marinus]|uniref:omptin family outer membrane protease n=1 Tax=Myroides marinus TaxID=703342 RepID=UPI002575892F|nr:omptin family outer membrane protease [Myroides marinus]MDM1384369.1 omptin family outer membrane protease [Myroides marinus]
MHKYYLLLSLYFISLSVHAQNPKQSPYIIPYTTWDTEELNWDIAGNESGKFPNLLSEIKWKDLSGPKLGIISGIPITPKLKLKLELSYKTIISGKVNDSDYAGDNKAVKTAEFNLQADKGHSIKTSLELSYLLLNRQDFTLNIHAGYLGYYKTLYMLDSDTPLNKDKKLNSTYKPRYHGVIYGLQTSYTIHNWQATLDISGIHLPSYLANANWNLREELQHPISFTHKSKASGYNLALHLGYHISKNLQPFITANYTQLDASKGTDKLYKINGNTHTTQLNRVHSSNFHIGVGIKIFLSSL